MTTNYSPGCYFDSHHGHYIVPEIIRMAQSEGRLGDSDVADALERYEAESHMPDYPMEQVIEESDRAIEYLNEHCGLEGHVWEWNDGDFGLYPIEEDE